jgi:hypothetical protein
MNTKRKTSLSIYIQAAVALMLIQLAHKIVREIPGAFSIGGSVALAVPVFAGLLVIGILLLLLKLKLGLILGMIDGAGMILQPFLVHIIVPRPDINGIWWYPIFPWTQAVLIIYFCRIAWKNW